LQAATATPRAHSVNIDDKGHMGNIMMMHPSNAVYCWAVSMHERSVDRALSTCDAEVNCQNREIFSRLEGRPRATDENGLMVTAIVDNKNDFEEWPVGHSQQILAALCNAGVLIGLRDIHEHLRLEKVSSLRKRISKGENNAYPCSGLPRR
jgi:hypothetical protein